MKVSLHSRLWLIILAAVFIYHNGIWHAEPVGSGEPEQICYMEHEDTPQIFRIPAPHHHEANNEHGECTQHNHHNWLFTSAFLHLHPQFITLFPGFKLYLDEPKETDYPMAILPVYHDPPVQVSTVRGPPEYRA